MKTLTEKRKESKKRYNKKYRIMHKEEITARNTSKYRRVKCIAEECDNTLYYNSVAWCKKCAPFRPFESRDTDMLIVIGLYEGRKVNEIANLLNRDLATVENHIREITNNGVLYATHNYLLAHDGLYSRQMRNKEVM